MIRPTGSYILIQPDTVEETGTIIKLGSKPTNTGKVLAVSKDIEEAEVVEGDRVQYLPNGRTDLEDGTILISETNILFKYDK